MVHRLHCTLYNRTAHAVNIFKIIYLYSPFPLKNKYYLIVRMQFTNLTEVGVGGTQDDNNR